MSGLCVLHGLSPASQARALALALAVRIAARRSASTESITRKAVGVEATGPKSDGLIAQHSQIREAVAPVGQHQRQVHEDAARIMAPRSAHCRCQRVAHRLAQAGELGHLGQQAGAGMGGDPLAIGGH